MAKIFAYALHTVHLPPATEGGTITIVDASTKDKVSVFETNADQLAQLERLGAARPATEDEIAIHQAAIAKANGQVLVPVGSDSDAEPELPIDPPADDAPVDDSPSKTADKDPSAKPKASKKAANSDDDI